MKFQWSEACERSFQILKNRVISSQVLTLSECTNGFVVYCDPSRVGLGCVLMQHGKVVAYASRKLKVHEKNYPTHYLYIATIEFALKISCIICMVSILMHIPTISLKYVFTEKEINLQQKRLLELLKDYDMSVLYHPYKVNVVSDARSRMIMSSVSQVEKYKKDQVKDVRR